MTPHETAAALSEAQKRAVMGAEIDGHLGRRFIRWWQADGQTARALRRKGLAFTVWSGLCLTDFGIATRTILEARNA